MSSKLFSLIASIVVASLILIGVLYLLSNIFHWQAINVSPKTILDVVTASIALLWLLFILKVPWDLYFETNNVLFEMKRSEEKNIPINKERQVYVQRMRLLTAIVAISSHLASAGIIAGLTYFTNGQIGYYFSFFYLLATCFRPISQAYYYLINKLKEIKGEVTYPREDVNQLKSELLFTIDRLENLEKRVTEDQTRLNISEETIKSIRSEINDTHFAIDRLDKTFQNRIQLLTSEVERSLTKAFDQQDIINGLRAFAKLIKQA